MLRPSRSEDLLETMLDEVWDLNEAIGELERRRGALRDHILAECQARGLDRMRHARGSLRVDRYRSYKVARATAVLPHLHGLGWEDEVLQIKGRVLHRLAAKRASTRAIFGDLCRETEHHVLVLTPAERRR